MTFDLSPFSMVVVSGTQAEAFLQSQLTCDVTQASDTTALLGAHCNIKGRMVSLFHLFKHLDSFCLVMPENVIEIAAKALKKYAQFSKEVDITIETDLPFVGVMDEPADIILGNAPHYGLKRSDIKGKGTFSDWQDAMIQNHHAWLTPETLGKFLPHDINLPNLGGVSFKKGCFIGQEIIARMEYLGKLKKHVKLILPAEITADETEICLSCNHVLVISMKNREVT